MRPAPPELDEEQWLQTIIDYAKLKGWRHYHTRNSRRSPSGFPDLTLVRGHRLVFAELKDAKRKATPEQLAWMADLDRVFGVETYLWRPADLHEVLAVLA